MSICSNFSPRLLSLATAFTLLAAGVPANARAGNDTTKPATHAQTHHLAKLSHARHLHYTTEPVIVAPKSTSDKKAEKKIQYDSYDESLFRSNQENNLLNPG